MGGDVQSRPSRGAVVNAISGVDIALWDASGRSPDQPVHRLLGGAFRGEGEDHTEAGIAEAKQRLAEGFRAMKLKVGFGVEEDIECVHEIRQAVGPEARIMMDANCDYDVPAARRVLLECEDMKIHFFEEPLVPVDLEGYRSLRNLTGTYLAAGENLFGKIGFRRWVSEGVLDILQPDLC